MVTITCYGGVNEIGGNKILLEDGDTRIFLDFGMNFARYGKYYAEFLQPRTCNGIGDLLELGIIPDIDNIYRNDFLANEGRKLTEEPMVDGVLISHAHASGHACGSELKEMIDIINPKTLIPIHTEHPDYFKKLVKVKVRLPEYGKPMEVN